MAHLRDLPGVDLLLHDPALSALCETYGSVTVRDALRTLQAEVRAHANGGEIPPWASSAPHYADHVRRLLRNDRYMPVFNLTGTIIHTNLGRALLSDELWQSVAPLVTRPTNLEYDLAAGQRGDRDHIVETQIAALTGCEAATVVNNNAAALLLVLNTFALRKRVPVSRGELIEIGGSFRLPELMTRAGCELVEVGTTNRTHLKDFAAVASDAAMLLKVHPSNYHIDGFTREVSAAELAGLAREHGIPSCVDLGSGTLVDLTRWHLPAEPTPQSVLHQGIDLVTFSGDKLLGGVQAGIICGRRDLLAALKKNPLKRALRADKITLAILSKTLQLYQNPENLAQTLPLLATLTLSDAALQARAQTLQSCFPAPWQTAIEPSAVQIGSGALPAQSIPSVALTLQHPLHAPDAIQRHLRELPTPVVARVADARVWLDVRGADPLGLLVENLQAL